MLVKILLGIALLALLITGVSVYTGQTGVAAQLAHIPAVFNMIAGNIHAMNGVFPVVDLLSAFGAMLAVEGLVLLFKLYKFTKGHFNN